MDLTTPSDQPSRPGKWKAIVTDLPVDTAENDLAIGGTVLEPMTAEMLIWLRELRDLICFPSDPTQGAVTFTSTAAIGICLGMPPHPTFFEPTGPHTEELSLSDDAIAAHSLHALHGLSKHTVTFWAIFLERVALHVYVLIAAHNSAETESLYGPARPQAFRILHTGHARVMSLKERARLLADGNSFDSEPLSFAPLRDWMVQVQFGTVSSDHRWPSATPATDRYYAPGSFAQKSPLEILMPTRWLEGLPGGRYCSISQLSKLSSLRLPRVAVESVGRLRTLHLFRSKKLPFNHEYIVAGFGPDGQPPTSWIRLERAAREKEDPLAPRADSLHPALSGVRARETVTFASSLAALCSNSNELGALELQAFSMPLFIQSFITQTLQTSTSNILYQLFTANCRWFARRVFLNVLLYSVKTQVPHNLQWKGKTTPFLEVKRKLTAEPFGGSKLADKTGRALDFEAIMRMQLADPWLCEVPSPSAFDSHIQALEGVNMDSDQKNSIRAYLMIGRGCIRSATNLSEGLSEVREAITLVRGWPSRSPRRDPLLQASLCQLARILGTNGMVEGAITPLREAIAIALELDPASASVAKMRCDLGHMLSVLPTPNLVEAVEEYEKAWKIMHASHGILQVLNDFQISDQARHLLQYARLLGTLGRVEDRVQAIREAVALSRDFRSNSLGVGLLQDSLISLAVATHEAGLQFESFQRAKEAVTLGQKENCLDRSGRLVFLFLQCALDACEYSIFRAALYNLENAIVIAREADNDIVAPLQLVHLRVFAFHHMRSRTLHEVLEEIRKLVMLEWDRLSGRPDSYKRKTAYVNSLIVHGKSLLQSDQPEEAIGCYAEATQVLATRGDRSREAEGEVDNFADFVAGMLIADRTEVNEYIAEITEGTVESCRALYIRDPSDHNRRDALRQELLRFSQIQSDMGHHEDASSTESEAAQLAGPLEANPTPATQIAHLLEYAESLKTLGRASAKGVGKSYGSCEVITSQTSELRNEGSHVITRPAVSLFGSCVC